MGCKNCANLCLLEGKLWSKASLMEETLIVWIDYGKYATLVQRAFIDISK